MFIFLALENMRIYLIGGVLLALIAILAIALTNYLEDRRTLGLLRVRGVSPGQLFRFFASSLLAPALLGLAVGLLVAGAAGFGLTNLIWSLRELKSVVHLAADPFGHLGMDGLDQSRTSSRGCRHRAVVQSLGIPPLGAHEHDGRMNEILDFRFWILD